MKSLYCAREDAQFPIGLKNIQNPPKGLYYCGNIDIINNNANIALVGTRRPSEQGHEMAYRMGEIAAEMGVNVVNGLAIGCDTDALNGALSASGKCIAVLPGGLSEIVPVSNNSLAERIVENGGCLITEYEDYIKPQRYSYVKRDRLQSGISSGVIIIEADVNSGTMHTANFAIRQSRRLACYASKLLKYSEGNFKLISQGKGKRLESEDDIRSFYLQILKHENDTMQYEQLSFI